MLMLFYLDDVSFLPIQGYNHYLLLLPAFFLLSKVFMVNLDIYSEIRYLPDEKVTLDQVYFFLNFISFSGFLNTFFNGGIPELIFRFFYYSIIKMKEFFGMKYRWGEIYFILHGIFAFIPDFLDKKNGIIYSIRFTSYLLLIISFYLYAFFFFKN